MSLFEITTTTARPITVPTPRMQVDHTTNFSICPTYSIRLEEMSRYAEIKALFRKLQIDRYIYVIIHQGIIAKFGISHRTNQDVADRIYTQIGYTLGWDQPCLKRSEKKTGAAMREMMRGMNNGKDFHKNDVELLIYDFTNYPFAYPNEKTVYAEMQNAEEELKNNYKLAFGKYPPGNIKQEKIRKVVNPELFNSLFDWN